MEARKLLMVAVAASVIAPPNSLAFEIVETTPEVTVMEGEELSLRCSADAEFFTCTWHHVPSGKKCTMLSGSEHSTCQDEERYSWETSDPLACEFRISGASVEEDSGQHRCTLIFFAPDSASSEPPQNDIANVTVAVARAAAPILGGDLQVSMDDGWEDEDEETSVAMTLAAGEEKTLECSAESAFPKPELSFTIRGREEDDGEETLGVESSFDGENEDGTFYANVSSLLVPSPFHGGHTVCCESLQLLPDGEEISRKACSKLKVRFPPQEATAPLGPYGFTEGEPSVSIELHFTANPAPEDNRAIWHISPIEGQVSPGAETMVLQAGTEHESGKYVASPLNTSDVGHHHHVTARITILDLTAADADFEYALHASNEYGEAAYSFRLVMARDEEEVEETYEGFADGQDMEGMADAAQRSEAVLEDEEVVQEGGVGTGTIVGICIVVVAIAFIALLIFWAKSKEKMCFSSQASNASSASSTEKLPKEKAEKKKKMMLFKKKNKEGAGEVDVENGGGDGERAAAVAETQPLNMAPPPTTASTAGGEAEHHQHAKGDDVD